MPLKVDVQPFRIAVAEQALADLRDRLRRARWPDQIAAVGWDQGTELGWLQELVASWEAFDWRPVEREINACEQYRVEVGGLGVHVLVRPGAGPDPLPLLLTHGWPGSFVEYLDLIPLLADPAAHGGDPADAFTVVVPSLPGYGFSDRPNVTGVTSATVAGLWSTLMTAGFGYPKFGAHGTDIGAGVTARLARADPEHVIGIHLAAASFPPPPRPWTTAEAEYFAAEERWDEEEGGYSAIQATKPQTLAYGLTDSPAGLAAWLGEKYHDWSDRGPGGEPLLPRHRLLATLTLYWVTGTAASSLRPYWEYRHHGEPLAPCHRPPVPAGFTILARELGAPPPRELAERYYDLRRWTELPSGGHFPALEVPELLAAELRAFFRPFRRPDPGPL
jgi:pimeloyl-ACP methyl ester carboxylesterase